MYTPGGTFAGPLTGYRRWFELLQESVRSVGDLGDQIAVALEPIGETIDTFNARDESTIGFIHLENAHQLQGSTWVPLAPSMIWRGAFTEVTGWTLGSPS